MSENTVHKTTTVHSLKTPHKYPDLDVNESDILNDLSLDLYPTGRAWYRVKNGVFENFHKAINVSFSRLLNESNLLIDSTFPDNDNFTEEDALLWEFRLGLITNLSLELEFRKEAIIRKLGHPNNIEARQHYLFIQSQLQLAGFNVWVHPNTIPYQTPSDISNINLTELQHADDTQHGGGTQHGGDSFSVIANSVNEIESYAIGDDNLWATFFLGGEILGNTAEVSSSRLKEFKELVIKLKPAHTVALTFINYI